MKLHAPKSKDMQARDNNSSLTSVNIKDSRPQALLQRKMLDTMEHSAVTSKGKAIQDSIHNSSFITAQRKVAQEAFGAVQTKSREEEQPAQMMKEEEEEPAQMMKDEEEESVQMKRGGEEATVNSVRTTSGIPIGLKSGIESLSGVSMDNVNVHYNSSSPAQLNALAYAQGNNIHLAPGQEKHLPHEAWHIVQQRQGRVKPTTQLKGTSVNDDSSLEKEADEMGQKALTTKGEKSDVQHHYTSVTNTVQRYSLYSKDDQNKDLSLGWKNPLGDDLAVAEDGTLAAKNHTKQAWAEQSKITEANDILKNRNSKIRLEAGASEISGKAPNDGRTIKKLKEVKAKSDTGGGATLTADCGTAAMEGVGIKNDKFVGVTREKGTENYTRESLYRAGHGINSTTGDMESDIYLRIMQNEFKQSHSSGLDAMNAFYKLSKSEQDRISKKYGINGYARAKVGQGLTIGTDSDADFFDFRGGDAWNFHFATVIFNSKDDDMTIENFAGNSGGDTGWYYVLLGPASKKQDFHYHNGEELGGHGDKYTTFVVENSELIIGTINTPNVHLVGDPAKYDIIEKLPSGTNVKTLRKGVNWRKVEVTGGVHAGKTGWILNKYFSN